MATQKRRDRRAGPRPGEAGAQAIALAGAALVGVARGAVADEARLAGAGPAPAIVVAGPLGGRRGARGRSFGRRRPFFRRAIQGLHAHGAGRRQRFGRGGVRFGGGFGRRPRRFGYRRRRVGQFQILGRGPHRQRRGIGVHAGVECFEASRQGEQRREGEDQRPHASPRITGTSARPSAAWAGARKWTPSAGSQAMTPPASKKAAPSSPATRARCSGKLAPRVSAPR
ncbi:hypothetical protein SAMN04488012_11428 [Palleronia salina]|uniref:Uncharacterized protein n=1 Tax=Palleronia salina TaxID=313368 RepID=A0A1M6L4D2_9RHOB|nr:hypothetical protein SAMN04488012_11428 [Palleronia salina]